MIKKFLYPAFLTMLASAAYMLAAVTFTNINTPQLNNGGLVFAETYRAGLNFSKVKITTPLNHMTFELDNNLWLMKEADYYYANLEFLNHLFTDFNNARYLYPQDYSEQAVADNHLGNPQKNNISSKGVLIETYDRNNNQLDSVIIGKETSNHLFHFAKNPQKNEIWLIDGPFELPEEPYSWLMQPILNYYPDMFEKVEIVDGEQSRELNRNGAAYPFFNEKQQPFNPNALLERFKFLIASEILSAQNFDETLFPSHRSIILTTFSGLITQIDLFHDQKNYWIKISLSTTNLPTAQVNAYIRDNRFLYDGWYFKVPASTGEVMANFNIL